MHPSSSRRRIALHLRRFSALVVGLLVPLVCAAPAVEFLLLDSGHWREALLLNGLEQKYPALILTVLPDRSGWIYGQSNANPLELPQSILRALVPPEYLFAELDRSLTAIDNYLNLRSPELESNLDLRPLAERLANGEMKTALADLLDSLPVCDMSFLSDFQSAVPGAAPESLTVCQPPPALRLIYLEAWQAMFTTISRTLPPQVRLLPVRHEPPGLAYATARWLLRVSPLILLVFLLLGIFQHRAAHQFGKWLSTPFLFGGITSLLLILASWSLSGVLLGLPLNILPAKPAYLYAFFQQTLMTIISQSALMAALGASLFCLIGLAVRCFSARRKPTHQLVIDPSGR